MFSAWKMVIEEVDGRAMVEVLLLGVNCLKMQFLYSVFMLKDDCWRMCNCLGVVS